MDILNKEDVPKESSRKEDLEKAHLANLIDRFKAGDMKAGTEILEKNIGICGWHLREMGVNQGNQYYEDLFQEARKLLLKRVVDFDPYYKSKYGKITLLGYTRKPMRRELSRFLVEEIGLYTTYLNEEILPEINRANEYYLREFDRFPTDEEVAKHTKLPLKKIIQAKEAFHDRLSLDEEVQSNKGSLVGADRITTRYEITEDEQAPPSDFLAIVKDEYRLACKALRGFREFLVRYDNRAGVSSSKEKMLLSRYGLFEYGPPKDENVVAGMFKMPNGKTMTRANVNAASVQIFKTLEKSRVSKKKLKLRDEKFQEEYKYKIHSKEELERAIVVVKLGADVIYKNEGVYPEGYKEIVEKYEEINFRSVGRPSERNNKNKKSSKKSANLVLV